MPKHCLKLLTPSPNYKFYVFCQPYKNYYDFHATKIYGEYLTSTLNCSSVNSYLTMRSQELFNRCCFINKWVIQSLIYLVRTHNFPKNYHFPPWYAYVPVQGVRNISFTENLAYVLNGWCPGGTNAQGKFEPLRRYQLEKKTRLIILND